MLDDFIVCVFGLGYRSLLCVVNMRFFLIWIVLWVINLYVKPLYRADILTRDLLESVHGTSGSNLVTG